MPICNYPLGCTNYAVKGDVRCDSHRVRNETDRKNEKAVVKKHQVAEAGQKRNAEERAARDKRAQDISDRQERQAALRAEVIRTHKQTWSAQITAVFNQVVALRAHDPNANAGHNAVGNTPGGNTNPIHLTLTGATFGVTPADICPGIAGFDTSDSGVFKFRRKSTAGNGGDILIHCG